MKLFNRQHEEARVIDGLEEHSDKARDPSALVVPFGKYRGSTVADLLNRDGDYARWIVSQAWVAERFAELHAAILCRGKASDDTPAHNALQARFLDPAFAIAFLLSTGLLSATPLDDRAAMQLAECGRSEGNPLYGAVKMRKAALALQHDTLAEYRQWAVDTGKEELLAHLGRPVAQERLEIDLDDLGTREIISDLTDPLFEVRTRVEFERNGIDVILAAEKFSRSGRFLGGHSVGPIGIELKPSVGDDYPSVMRQMRRLNCRDVVVGTTATLGVTPEQLRAMFVANGCRMTLVSQIESRLGTAQTLIAGALREPQG